MDSKTYNRHFQKCESHKIYSFYLFQFVSVCKFILLRLYSCCQIKNLSAAYQDTVEFSSSKLCREETNKINKIKILTENNTSILMKLQMSKGFASLPTLMDAWIFAFVKDQLLSRVVMCLQEADQNQFFLSPLVSHSERSIKQSKGCFFSLCIIMNFKSKVRIVSEVNG